MSTNIPYWNKVFTMIEWINKVLVISRHLLIIFTFKTIFLTISKPSLNKKDSDPKAFISYKDILQAPFEVKNRARTFRIIALKKKFKHIFKRPITFNSF